MSSKGARIVSGEVAITLDGEERILKPTLNAASRISRQYGGYQPVLKNLNEMEFDTCAYIIRHGLNLSDAEARSLPDRIFRSGVLNLIGPLSTYILQLANGGKPLDADKAADGDDSGDDSGDDKDGSGNGGV